MDDFQLDLKKLESTLRELTTPDKPVFSVAVREDPNDPLVLRQGLITCLEVSFWETGKYPSLARLEEEFPNFPVELIASTLNDKTFDESLLNRGLPVYEGLVKYRLDPMAVMAANLICDISDKRSVAAKLKSLNLTTRDWRGFRRDPEFKKYLQSRVNEVFNEELEENSKLAVARLIESDDLAAIKYFHEFTGRFKPQQNNEVLMLNLVLARLMEILVQFLTPDQLQIVADTIETTGRELNAGDSKSA